MRSFQVYVGHGSRLTAAGRVVLLLAAAITVALGFAGSIWGVSRLQYWLGTVATGAAVHVATAAALYLGAAAGGVAVWSAGAGLCRLAGLPLITPGRHGWDGMLSVARERSRRPIQFTLGGLQLAVFLVAVLCALTRLDIIQIGLVMYLFGMLTVITCGTAGVVLQGGTTSLRGGMVRGGLAGSCLSAVCLGWMFVLLWIIKPSIHPLLVLASITLLGGLLGVLIGLARSCGNGRVRAAGAQPSSTVPTASESLGTDGLGADVGDGP
jgi:hypothetical protein